MCEGEGVGFPPSLPFSSAALEEVLGSVEGWYRPELTPGRPIGKPTPLFAKVDVEALLADHADEQDVVIGLDACFFHGPQRGEHDDQAARVIPDTRGVERVAPLAYRHIGALREHGVQVATESDRALSGPAAPWL